MDSSTIIILLGFLVCFGGAAVAIGYRFGRLETRFSSIEHRMSMLVQLISTLFSVLAKRNVIPPDTVRFVRVALEHQEYRSEVQAAVKHNNPITQQEADKLDKYVDLFVRESDFLPEPEDSIGSTTDITYTDSGAVVSGVSYYYAIRCVSASGGKSEPSNFVGELDIILRSE